MNSFNKYLGVLLGLLLVGCATTPESTDDEFLGYDGVDYTFIDNKPPGDLLHPPTFNQFDLIGTSNSYTNQYMAYEDAVGSYHAYIGRSLSLIQKELGLSEDYNIEALCGKKFVMPYIPKMPTLSLDDVNLNDIDEIRQSQTDYIFDLRSHILNVNKIIANAVGEYNQACSTRN